MPTNLDAPWECSASSWRTGAIASSAVTSFLPPSDRAETRLRSRPHVWFEERSIPEQWPTGQFDLVVLSEIAYYFDEADLGNVLECVMNSTASGAHVVGVHWRGETDYPLSGDRCHELIAQVPWLVGIVQHREDKFLLDVWERR